MAPGEAVLVEWGRRRALGVVLGDAPPPPDGVDRQAARRARPGGRAAPAAALPGPGPRDRRALPRAGRARDPGDAPAGPARAARPRRDRARQARGPATTRPPRRCWRRSPRARGRCGPCPSPRAGPRSCAACGRSSGRAGSHLEWTLGAAGALPRYERWATATPAGRAAAGGRAGARTAGPLGPRQRALLAELAALPPTARAPPPPALAARHGAGALGLAGPARPRRPGHPGAAAGPARASGPPGGAARGRPETSLSPAQAAAVAAATRALAARDATPLLLDGPTGAGKTAVYAEAIAASLAAGRPALVLVPEIALALPLVDRLRADLGAEVAVLHSALGEGERADAWRRIRAGAVDVVVGTRIGGARPARRRRARRRRRGARGDVQERPDAALPGARRRRPPRGARRRRRRPRERHAVGRVDRPRPAGPLPSR